MLAGWSLEAAAGEWGGTEAARWPDPRDGNDEGETLQMKKGIGAAVVIAVVLVAIVLLYVSHRGERNLETAREAPVVAPSRVEVADAAVLVAIDSSAAERIGLEVAPLAAGSAAQETRLTGEVVAEPERRAVIRAPVAGRLSVPHGASWPGLGDRIASGHVFAQVSDALPIAAPISGTITRVGAQPGAIVEAGQELLEIVDRSRPLVRIVWTLSRRHATLDDRAWAREWSGAGHWPAGGPVPRSRPRDPPSRLSVPCRSRVAGVGAWYSGGSSGCRRDPGERIRTRGAFVPDRAVVQWDGLAWTYLRRAPDRFERVRVATDRPVSGGWIVLGGLEPGDSVVVTGAQELLSEEFRARVTVGDESGE